MADYHDYWIKDGRFVGDFEGMYANCAMPWHQDEQEAWPDVLLGIALLREFAPFDAIHDLAAGTGHFLDIVGRHLGTDNVRLSGADIAPSACRQAAATFARAAFAADDLKRAGSLLIPPGAGRQLYMLRGTLWCLYPDIVQAIDHLPSRVPPGALFYVAQNFPPLDGAFIGKDILPTPETLDGHLSRHFGCLRSLWFENRQSRGNDNWFIGLYRR